MSKLRVFLDFIEDFAYALWISFYTPKSEKTEDDQSCQKK